MDRPMHQLWRLVAAFIVVLVGLGAATAMADAPHNWALGFQPAASPVQHDIEQLHDLVLVIITAITVFVAALLLWVGYRFSAKKNAVPSQTSHNTVLEVAWTLVPVLILVVIAIPSFRLVYYEDRAQTADMTIKVTGHQWYWEYTYPDNENVNFSSRMVPENESKLRQLDVDEALVLPVGKNIRILTTSADVIHSFYIPSIGVQRYAIPGRTIETWVRVDRPGMYYGQCNQVCGTNHSSMPIGLRALPEAEFTAWVAQAKTKYASNAPNPAPDAARLAVARIQH
jgi:cytochrome c oxidase subunit 2